MRSNDKIYIEKIEKLLKKWDDFDFSESPQCHVYGEHVSVDHWLATNLLEVNEAYHRAEDGRDYRNKDNSFINND